MLVEYGWVSTVDHNAELQDDALRSAGCGKLFVKFPLKRYHGGKKDRPQLAAALDYVRAGDTLVVWRLDRLTRSPHQLIETVEAVDARNSALKGLTDAIDTGPPGGKLVFHIFGSIRRRAGEADRGTGGPCAHPAGGWIVRAVGGKVDGGQPSGCSQGNGTDGNGGP